MFYFFFNKDLCSLGRPNRLLLAPGLAKFAKFAKFARFASFAKLANFAKCVSFALELDP